MTFTFKKHKIIMSFLLALNLSMVNSSFAAYKATSSGKVNSSTAVHKHTDLRKDQGSFAADKSIGLGKVSSSFVVVHEEEIEGGRENKQEKAMLLVFKKLSALEQEMVTVKDENKVLRQELDDNTKKLLVNTNELKHTWEQLSEATVARDAFAEKLNKMEQELIGTKNELKQVTQNFNIMKEKYEQEKAKNKQLLVTIKHQSQIIKDKNTTIDVQKRKIKELQLKQNGSFKKGVGIGVGVAGAVGIAGKIIYSSLT